MTDEPTYDAPPAPCSIVRDLSLPIVATAIHAGHALRAEVAGLLALDAAERRREEDPFTDLWTTVAPTRVVGTHSRFEVDLNRPRDGAVYRTPDEAWGLSVWREPLPDGVVKRSLAGYDAFYGEIGALLDEVHARFGVFAVLDLHSYNHRRDGPAAAPGAREANPEVNIGTSILDRDRFGRSLENFADALRDPVEGEALDVREDVKFRGGHFSRWILARYPGDACALAIEFKKTFMDEWTGEPDEARIGIIGRRLAAAVPVLL
ncbi:MAG TPA: N-formylglutamate amidohydrolase, partial [Gemmatimonadaceae bacterium]|nr:N-formylglutamate amidohydrolase [Gemmatimonadaceae bacterium]